MGNIIPAWKFSKNNISGLLKPIIYCCPYEGIADTAVSINLLLAKKLVECRLTRRTMRIETFFNQILSQLPDGAVIKDFDVMFNPKYKVDVLRIMTVACKKKPFSVIWPGKCEDGKLFYAEDGYLDFKVFNVEEYDVTCVV
ncbi:MAG: BREX-3 system P-loop-containing protein BrxF [Clostridia bacterium]|nr:BREX-3 system P-loop-containing protein BrxF [Clostridia bacterium]